MRPFLLLAPLALLAAGCIGSAGTPEEAPTVAEPPAAAAEESLTSGAEANATAAPAGPVPVPFSYAGSSPTGVCTPVGVCEFAQGGAESYHVIEHEGHATRLAAQVTYGEQLPGMDFYVGICVGPEGSVECGDFRTGPSPLVVEFDLAAHVPGQIVALSIGSVSTPAAMAGALVLGPATFEVAGTLTVMPMP